MCGIAGYVGSRSLEAEAIQACLRQMHHRGPDSASFYHQTRSPNSRVYLLSSRLKIIDFDDRANQPFRLGSKVMTYNGELYNYVELKRELEASGRVFTTRSDTEVLLATLDEYGWQGLDRCEGMWAIAVYDEIGGSLTLSRDRFGEKPLYIYRDPTGMYFGSEVKFIVALVGRRLAVNYDQISRYMVNGYKALYKDGHTFFEGLQELAPSSALVLDCAGTEANYRFWQPAYCPRAEMSYEDAVAGSRERLIRAVERRLRADVPLAFCMSGGVDSNSLISIAKNLFDYDVHGFTIIVPDVRYDEQELVDYSVQKLGIRHTAIMADRREFLPRLRKLVIQHDAPVYTITYFAHWMLMQSIADHGYRISVSGTGADELFSGYYDHHLQYLYEVRDDAARLESARRDWRENIRPIVRNPFLRDPDLFLENPRFRDHIFLDASEFSGILTSRWYEEFEERSYTESLLRNRMLNEMFHEIVPPILHEDDLNAMSYSIENRSPYLDRDLFEFCNSIPSRHLIRNGYAKSLLRDAMVGVVPDRILAARRKIGFNAPISSFLDLGDPEVRRYLLNESPIFDHVERNKMAEMIAKPELSESESKFLFYFINSKMFLEEFTN